ncbi:MAG TPA: DUF4397 domain-containing protein [Gemmatimonadaceae bacterium]|nr:DUF4397 domain-containing protein [Gemmatimonadaceae bacterium]
MKLFLSARASLAALAIIAVGTTACSDDSTSPPQIAQIRFAHAAAGIEAVDFRVDDADIRTDAAFGDEVSAYGNIASGERDVAARLADGDEDLAIATEDLESGGQYTVVLVNGIDSQGLEVFADTNTAAPEGKTRLRIINAAQQGGEVDVYVTATDADLQNAEPVLTGIAMPEASKYVEVSSGEQRIRFTEAGTQDVLLDIESIDLPDTGVRTVLLIEADEGGTPLQSIVAEDRG